MGKPRSQSVKGWDFCFYKFYNKFRKLLKKVAGMPEGSEVAHTQKINSFNDIVKIGTHLKNNWFRGHSKLFHELEPKVFRDDFKQKVSHGAMTHYEYNLVTNFQKDAPAVLNNLPDQDDHLSWLLIMQHHGFPTRLLDWTKNILTALFFAVANDNDKNGELWSLNPKTLNKFSYMDPFPPTANSNLKQLAYEPFNNFVIQEKPKHPLAFLPREITPRITTQNSGFTIHPDVKREPHIYNLHSILTDKKEDLARYIIPKEKKEDFKENLRALGITYKSLFPDIEGLAKHYNSFNLLFEEPNNDEHPDIGND